MSQGSLFKKQCDFVAAAQSLGAIPPFDLPEIAFIGRSNVGKSSLINALTGRNKLARTSQTPGRTRQLNFFNLADRLMLVDLPGYGYAKVSKSMSADWQELIRAYLRGRPVLRRVCLLIDSRHGLKPGDTEIMALMDDCAVSYQLVLTKSDKTGQAALEDILQTIARTAAKHPACHPVILPTSAETRTGIAELQDALTELARSS